MKTEEFRSFVLMRGHGDCWEWLGGRTTKGYGRFRRNGKTTAAHRHALAMHLGRPIRAGKQCNHRCDNRACVNPNHLYEGTQKDNIGDAMRRRRMACQKPGFRLRGTGTPHARGTRHHRAKLTPDAVRHIRAMRGKMTQDALGERYGVPQSAISSVQLGNTWSHIK